MDVKFLDTLPFSGRQRYYQFTAIDDCTRFRVLRIYDHNSVKSAADFIAQVKEALPFAIQQVQTDNGSEFSLGLQLAPPGPRDHPPEDQGPLSLRRTAKWSLSHRTDDEEFYRVNRFVSIQHCMRLLREWEKEYNERRPHFSLHGKTPKEYLQEKLRNHISATALTAPVKSVQKVA